MPPKLPDQPSHRSLLRSSDSLISTLRAFSFHLDDLHLVDFTRMFVAVVETADVFVGLLDAAAFGEVAVLDCTS